MKNINKVNIAEFGKVSILDIVKCFCCFLILGSHCLPLFYCSILNYYYGQWFFRFCVPLFFISSGFFFSKMSNFKQWKYISRILVLYCIATLLYVPFFVREGIKFFIYSLIFGYRHLWYLSALLISLFLMKLLNRYSKINDYIVIIFTLWGGVLFDEYYKLFNSEVLCEIVKVISYLGGARHGIFFGLPMVLIGKQISQKDFQVKTNSVYLVIIYIVTMGLGFIESFILKFTLGTDITLDVSLFCWMPSIPLFMLASKTEITISKNWSRAIRKVSDIVYIMHVGVINVLGILFSICKFPLFVFASLLSAIIGIVVYFLMERVGLNQRI